MNKVNVKGSPSYFKNPFLDRLSRTHPLVIVSMYIPLSAFLLYYYYSTVKDSLVQTTVLFIVGFVVWTLTEYILHRYIFHWINESEFSKKFHYAVHGIHHDYPKDKTRLVMPPVPSVIIATLFFLLFRLFLGMHVYAFFGGFLMGYLTYGMIHYSVHAIRPPKNRLAILWEHHNKHHFSTPDKAFGVSSLLWDIVFGTMPTKKSKQKVAVGK
jgi:sterol desaturase/sphingolipid hydroxylase (fatty acid hydroxylase superfamily)